MKIEITIEISAAEQMTLLQNSIERVLNNAIYVGESTERKAKGDLSERASTLWQDCEELKPLVVKLWGGVAEAVRKELIAARSEGLK